MSAAAGICYGVVFGSLAAAACISEFRIPHQPYHAALAGILLCGFVMDILRGLP